MSSCLRSFALIAAISAVTGCGAIKSKDDSTSTTAVNKYSGSLFIGCHYPTLLELSATTGKFDMTSALCIPVSFTGKVTIEKNKMTLITDDDKLVGHYHMTWNDKGFTLKDAERNTYGEQSFVLVKND